MTTAPLRCNDPPASADGMTAEMAIILHLGESFFAPCCMGIQPDYHVGMRRFRSCRFLVATLVSASLMLLVPARAGVTLPDLGEASQADLSPQEEQRLGDATMRDIRLNDRDYLDDQPTIDYLNQLGKRLTDALDPAERRSFQFFALKDSSINAFALPGGYIGVHTGLLTAAQSESELAGVLAHEISHVTQHHIARGVGVQSQSYATMLAALAVALLAARSNPDVAQGALLAGQAGAIQQQLNYSRDYEREADRMGIRLLERAGFDIRGMETFFQRLLRQANLYESRNVPAYLQTHPLTTERIADMDNRIQGRAPHAVTDALDFRLVRARLAAITGSRSGSYAGFNEILRNQPDDPAARYGLAAAYLRDNRPADAARSLAPLLTQTPTSALIPLLHAQILHKHNQPQAALEALKPALARFPQARALWYAQIEGLLAMDRAQDALAAATGFLHQYPKEYRLHQFQAQAYAALGNLFQEHRAQGEAYALQGLTQLAIEQFELARKTPGVPFYDLAQADARLAELKRQFRAEAKENKP